MTQDVELQEESVESEAAEVEQSEGEKTPEELEALKGELEATHQALEERDQRVATLEAQLAGALARYREVLVASAPEIPPELVQGDTVAALDEAFAQARVLVERVPPGAPTRRGVDFSSLTSVEKIRLGLQQIQS